MPLSPKWDTIHNPYKPVQKWTEPTVKIQIAISTDGTEYIFAGYEPNGKIRITHPNGTNCAVPENRYKLKTCHPKHILKGHYYNYTAEGKFIS